MPPFRAKGSTKQRAYQGPRVPLGAPVGDGPSASDTAEDTTLSAASGSGHETTSRTEVLFEAVVETPLRAVWSFSSALERWVRPEAVAVLLMSYLFIGLPLMVVHWL